MSGEQNTQVSTGAKQDPAFKGGRCALSDGKVYFSYPQIHDTICGLVPEIKKFQPDVILAIGGGGYIPARMLRTELKIPILAVSLELYDDATHTMRKNVKKVQWFDETSGVGQNVRGKRVLIVDEVDDSRTTLNYCVEEVKKTNNPAAIAVAVVHNKIKPKKASLGEDIVYFAGENVPDCWNCYPWDAASYGNSIWEHERRADLCANGGEAGLGQEQSKVTPLVKAVGVIAVMSFALFIHSAKRVASRQH
jgi:hypoxanthine phosphoribosyltransferase